MTSCANISPFNNKIQSHYAGNNLLARVLSALEKAGKDLRNLQPTDLAPVDEFHIRGRKATIELAQAANLKTGMYVLDVGSGIGGPSRHIASEFGCRVVGVDLTEEYCQVAEALTELAGLAHLVKFQCADALDLPYPDDEFDVIWTQHTAMNISDKDMLYREMYRILKPGGVLAIYDILAGDGGAVHFPVPWALGQETSFLTTPDKLRILIEGAGFAITAWQDTTEAALTWFRNVTTGKAEVRPLGLHVQMGEGFELMMRNQLLNLEEDRIVLYQVTAVKHQPV